MSVLRDMASKRFWLSVVLTIAVALLLCAAGALMTVLGLTGMEQARWWVSFAWMGSVWIGSRYATAGKEQALLRSMMTAVISVGLLYLLGLTTGGGKSGGQMYAWNIGAALVGALLAAAIPRKKRGRGRKKGREAQRATRGR